MFYPKSPFVRNKLVESQLIKRNGAVLLELLPWLCQTPTVTTYRVNLLLTTVNDFKLRVGKLLAQKYEHPPRIFEIPGIPEVVCIEQVETSLSTATKPDQCKEVIVDSCCGAAVLRGAPIYAPGVLAMEGGTRKDDTVAVYVDMAGKCKRGTSTRFDSADKLFVGLGVAHMQRYQLYSAKEPVEGVAIEMKTNISGVPSLSDLSDKFCLLQNLPSIVCGRVLDAQPGERVLDMCAAPGNKTTHIAEMMRDKGLLVALDKTPKKVAYIQEKLDQNGLTCVKTFAFDATKAARPKNFDDSAGFSCAAPPFAPQSFDRILLDAPCSALGNRPVLTSEMTPKLLLSFPKVQRNLFNCAVQLLRPNGVLVYSTCTITAAENEEMVAWSLKKFPQLQLVAATPRFGGFGLPELGLDEEQRKLVQRFGPGADKKQQQLETVGFFIAKFIKKDLPSEFVVS